MKKKLFHHCTIAFLITQFCVLLAGSAWLLVVMYRSLHTNRFTWLVLAGLAWLTLHAASTQWFSTKALIWTPDGGGDDDGDDDDGDDDDGKRYSLPPLNKLETR